MSMESLEHLEHMVRGRVKTFLRHTWLVTILGTLLLVGAVWVTVYLTTKATVMRIAAGPADSVDAKFVQALGKRFVQDHHKMRIQLVTTDGPAQSADAIAKHQADLGIVRSEHRHLARLAGRRHPAPERDGADRAGCPARARGKKRKADENREGSRNSPASASAS